MINILSVMNVDRFTRRFQRKPVTAWLPSMGTSGGRRDYICCTRLHDITAVSYEEDDGTDSPRW